MRIRRYGRISQLSMFHLTSISSHSSRNFGFRLSFFANDNFFFYHSEPHPHKMFRASIRQNSWTNKYDFFLMWQGFINELNFFFITPNTRREILTKLNAWRMTLTTVWLSILPHPMKKFFHIKVYTAIIDAMEEFTYDTCICYACVREIYFKI